MSDGSGNVDHPQTDRDWPNSAVAQERVFSHLDSAVTENVCSKSTALLDSGTAVNRNMCTVYGDALQYCPKLTYIWLL